MYNISNNYTDFYYIIDELKIVTLFILYKIKEGIRMLRVPALELATNKLEITVAGTPETIPTIGQIREVMVTAKLDNTGLIVVGGSNIDANMSTMVGQPLYSGDTFIVDVDELDLIYVDAEVSGEGVLYLYIW